MERTLYNNVAAGVALRCCAAWTRWAMRLLWIVKWMKSSAWEDDGSQMRYVTGLHADMVEFLDGRRSMGEAS
jgi:hypothetical protein